MYNPEHKVDIHEDLLGKAYVNKIYIVLLTNSNSLPHAPSEHGLLGKGKRARVYPIEPDDYRLYATWTCVEPTASG